MIGGRTPEYRAEHKSILDELLLDLRGVRPGKMFGYQAYFAGEKLSICLVDDGVGVKLPANRVEAILSSDPATTAFQPLSRPMMREWVQINCSQPEGLRDYQLIFEESTRYVLGLNA